MENYLIITHLNDFIFCPYSIYLHHIYEAHDTDVYYEEVQEKGLNSHKTIDTHSYSTSKSYYSGIPVYSSKYDLMGKIDLYKIDKKILIERKNRITTLYQGYIYQLYAQYFCMLEMGFEIEKICFYSVSSKKTFWIDLPNKSEIAKFETHLSNIRNFEPESFIQKNRNKCSNCIYYNLCDKH